METSQSWIANVEILNAQLRKESWYNTFWSKFAGSVKVSQDDNGNPVYAPSGKPIEILNAFIQEGRDNMLIPFLKELTGSPVFGDTVLKGTGEDQTMHWLRSYVNQYRKAVMKKSGSMSEQRQKIFKLYEAAKPQLSKWFSKYENQAIFETFYQGVSPNLSVGTASDGLGLAMRLHPNWFYIDHDTNGTLTTFGSVNTTKTVSILDTVVAADGQKAIHGKALQTLRVKCMTQRIPQIVTKSGLPFWALLVHPEQMKTLQQESVFLAAQQAAFTGKALDLPELAGAQGFYAGFAIFEDIVGVRKWDNTAAVGQELFGATTATRMAPDASSPSNANYNAIVFGNGSIGKGVAKDLHFTNEVDDHENTIEVGGAAINGYNRAEFFAESDATEGAGDAFLNAQSAAHYCAALSSTNQSSLVLMTS